MKTIREWLEEDVGVTLNITSLTSYISRIRRRESLHAGVRREDRDRITRILSVGQMDLPM